MMEKIIVSCGSCGQKLRVPGGGDFDAKCPKCGFSWTINDYFRALLSEETDFNKSFDSVYQEKMPDFNDCVNIALVGKVSAGKSSLLNAIFQRGRNDQIAQVGASSGVTTKVTSYKLEKDVFISDCPGLEDIRKENSEETKKFIENIDIGVFVVTGSADLSQKTNFDDLKKSCQNVIVVLNKADEWDQLDDSALHEVIAQWKIALNVQEIFPTTTKGFDPKQRKDAPMDVRGVDVLREKMFFFLKSMKKDLQFARQMREKSKYATGIISGALLAVSAEAFIPGSAVYITATQVVSIVSLNYLYTGNTLNKTAALAMLPQFAGQTVGTTAFLWIKSFLPPTGVIDIAAAAVAASITFAMLSAVKWMLENGKSLDDGKMLIDMFSHYKNIWGKNKFKNESEIRNAALNLQSAISLK